MVTATEYVSRVLDLWRDQPCPFCRKPVDPFWLCILSTYSIQCTACDEVIESFEVYQDRHGHLWTENHLRALGKVRGADAPSWERVPT